MRAYDPREWRPFLQHLSEAMEASGADVGVFGESVDAQIHSGVGIVGPEFLRDYAQHFWEDPYLLAGRTRGLLRTGTIGVGEELVPSRELERTSFFNDFGKQYDYHGGLSAIVTATNELCVTVNVCKPPQRSVGRSQVALMEALMPHLQRAIQIHLRLAEADARVSGLHAALNTLTAGALIVDASGRVVFLNDSARGIIAQRDGLTIERGELRAARPADTAALRSLIAAAATPNAHGTGGGGLAIRRSGSRPPLQIVVAPAPARDGFLQPRALAVVFIHDSAHTPEADPERLRRLFGFTRMEAAVAVQLLNSKSVREIAAESSISVNTVRFHLKQLFSKTGTARQAELVRLLSATVQLRPEGRQR
jgi:DNA-binding CsgD family transcriptional regulator